MAILAFPVNRIMFGDQWDQAIPIMRILCVAGAIGALSPIHGHVLIATGRVRTLFRAECIIQPLFVSLYLMAASFGLQWIAGAAILGWICVVGLYLAILIPHLRLRTRDFVRAIAASLKLALCAAALPAAAVALVPERPDTVWILFFLGGAGAPAGFLAGLWATGHPLKDELLILARRVKLLGRPSGAA
jgi:O-antigen/teichoic acid export membrane protein